MAKPKPSIYSEVAIPNVEVTYYCYSGSSWSASSSNMQRQFDHGLFALEDTYAKLRKTVEEVVPWSLERDDVEIEHYIEEASIPQYIAERETAERAAGSSKSTAGTTKARA